MAEIEQQSTELKLIVPWGHIAAKTYGSSTGKCVLMVHGLLDNMGSFTRLLKYLPMDYYYVCVDLPGHGCSSHFPSWMMLESMDYVHTIYYILEALQWKTCIYIGHSIGLVPVIANKEDTFIESLKESLTLPTQVQNNAKSNSYTKEEVLHALRNMRFAALNSDAAEALFERTVTEVDGKYKYIKDTRLKMKSFSLFGLKQLIYIVRNLSVPLYLLIASHGGQEHYPYVTEVIESINPKSLSQLFYVKGNHDLHNNNPERVAPLICKILHDNFSKL